MISLRPFHFKFFNQRVLFLSADKAAIYHWHKGNISRAYLFDINAEGQKHFERYLTETKKTPLTILVDITEETFCAETIPPVFGSERRALIERKKTKLLRHADYTHVQKQGREVHGRKDERLLFMALTPADLIKPWLALLDQQKQPLAGITSVPLLLESYIKTLAKVSEQALFITLESISGLRQTFFQRNHLKISRLSKLPRYNHSETYEANIETEVKKMRHYLNSLRFLADDSFLDIYIIANETTLAALKKRSITIPMTQFHYLDINKPRKTNIVKNNVTIPFCDRLLIEHLCKNKTKNCYASEKEMRHMKMRRIRYAMNVMSISLVLISVLYSGINFLTGMDYKQRSEKTKSNTVSYQTHYDLAQKKLPQTEVKPMQVKEAVDTVAIIKQYKATPYQMMGVIGKALAQYPDLKLDTLSWHFSTSSNEDMGMTGTGDEKRYYQISDFNIHLEAFAGDHRSAITRINHFIKTLRLNDTVYAVNIETFPLDISSNTTLRGNTKTISKQAVFSLRMVMGINVL